MSDEHAQRPLLTASRSSCSWHPLQLQPPLSSSVYRSLSRRTPRALKASAHLEYAAWQKCEPVSTSPRPANTQRHVHLATSRSGTRTWCRIPLRRNSTRSKDALSTEKVRRMGWKAYIFTTTLLEENIRTFFDDLHVRSQFKVTNPSSNEMSS